MIPELSNSLFVPSACLTASTSNGDSFWAWAIRKGAIGFSGKISTTFLNVNDLYFLNSVYYDNHALGDSFKETYSSDPFQRMATFIGDPVLNIAPTHLLKNKIELTKTIICQDNGGVCFVNSNCCAGTTCDLFTCKDCYSAGTDINFPYLDNGRCCNGWDWVTRQDANFCCYNNPTYTSNDANFCCWANSLTDFGCWWNADNCGTHSTQHYDLGCWWNAEYCGTTSVNDHQVCA